MMGIAQKVARNFSDAVRSRGQSYFVKGRVTLMAARAGEVVARVRGTSKYRVRLRLRGSKLLASCTCPYFSPQGEPCKHLWATLLLAEARGLVAVAAGFSGALGDRESPPLVDDGLPETRRIAAGTWTESRWSSENLDLGLEMIGLSAVAAGWSGCREEARPRARTGGSSRSDGRARELEPAESCASGLSPRAWKPIQDQGPGVGTRHRPGQRGRRPSIATPSGCLVYVLDVSATLAQNQVVIDLARRQRKTTGEWGPLRPWYYAPHAAHVKYDPEDRLILALLDEAQGDRSQWAVFSPVQSTGSAVCR